jgi:LacI family transcriptional regulator
MMHHLFAAGHSDIAFILDDPGNARAQLRLQAYLDAMSVAGMSTRAGRLAEGGGSYRSGLAAARELLGHPDRPSAIFACNDDMAAAVVSVAQGMGLRVPQDLAVCGFDDMPIAASVWPGLTTIRQPVDEMARAAVQLALEAIKDAGRPRHCVLPYTLVQRESTTARATH